MILLRSKVCDSSIERIVAISMLDRAITPPLNRLRRSCKNGKPIKAKTHLAFVQRDASGVNVPNIATRGKGGKKILRPPPAVDLKWAYPP